MNNIIIEERAVAELREKFSTLRIVNPRADAAMEESMWLYGQLSPVVCVRSDEGYELIDGFKRLRACRRLNRPTVKSVLLETGVQACKAAIIRLNRVGCSISDMEEAMVLKSLHREDLMSQVEIGVLLGRHKSWVSRRIALIEKLSEEMRRNIELGLVCVSVGRELAKLPQGNQQEVLSSIQKHRMGKRDVEKLVHHILSSSRSEFHLILSRPWEFIQPNTIPPGFEGKLIAMQRIHLKVLNGAEMVTSQEVKMLWDLLHASVASAKKVAENLELALGVKQ